jgi:UDP-N-acetyl-D-mannosaminuronate dehydrogenase
VITLTNRVARAAGVSAAAAELVKLYENTFRMINISLANKMLQVGDRLGVDVCGGHRGRRHHGMVRKRTAGPRGGGSVVKGAIPQRLNAG